MKRKKLSILHRERQHAPKDAASKRRKTLKTQTEYAGNVQQPPKKRATSTAAKPTSVLHQQASHAVARLLDGDEKRRGISIKSLTLAPHIQAPAATHAVTVETLKHIRVLDELLARTNLLASTPGFSRPVAAVLVRDLLFGQGLRPAGRLERSVLAAEPALRRELGAMLAEAGATSVAELLPAAGAAAAAAGRPRPARVNLLKMGVEEALAWLRSPPPPHSGLERLARGVTLDTLLPDVLLFPPGTDLHAHPLVASGALVLQSRASCMPAHALAPAPGWQVVDACAAPGNKTTHLAALMGGHGRVLAHDKDARRLARLCANAERAGAAACVDARLADFLSIDPRAPDYAPTAAVLLDPSCSGSGTAHARGDDLLPSAAARPRGAEAVDHTDARVEALARFQEAALRHALAFPAARRVVYSTCSLHARENEAVVAAVLPQARAAGWALADPFPSWRRRGVAGLVEGAELLVRTDPEEDGTDGFFVALFVRDGAEGSGDDSLACVAADAGVKGIAEMEQQQRQQKKKRKHRQQRRQVAEG